MGTGVGWCVGLPILSNINLMLFVCAIDAADDFYLFPSSFLFYLLQAVQSYGANGEGLAQQVCDKTASTAQTGQEEARLSYCKCFVQQLYGTEND